MAEREPHGPGGRTASLILVLLTVASSLTPLWAEQWKWISSLGAAFVGGAGLWFTWKANRRADDAVARAIAADQRSAEAHEWERAEREQAERAREARRPVEEWVAAMKKEHSVGRWFPIFEPEWEMAHAAARLDLAEVDDKLAAHRMGRARIR